MPQRQSQNMERVEESKVLLKFNRSPKDTHILEWWLSTTPWLKFKGGLNARRISYLAIKVLLK